MTAPPGRLALHREAPPAEDRGELHLHDRVVARIATGAASEVDGIVGAARRILGQTVGSDGGAPSVDVSVSADVASVGVVCAVRWPEPVHEVVSLVQQRVRDRVQSFTGLHVSHVDVTVKALPLPSTAATRRVT